MIINLWKDHLMCFCSFITSRGPLVTTQMFKAFIILVGNLLWNTRWPVHIGLHFKCASKSKLSTDSALFLFHLYIMGLNRSTSNMYLKGFGPPIIKGTGLYKLILVWRGFIMTVHIVVWVITLMISLWTLLNLSWNIDVF